MLSGTHELQCLIMSPAAATKMSCSISAAFLSDSFHCCILINCLASTVKRIKKKIKEVRLVRGGEGCRRGDCCCQNVCLHRPCPLPPRAACPPAAVISWLSSGKEMAKQGPVYLCRLYSLHIPAAGQRHHSNLPGSAKKGPGRLVLNNSLHGGARLKINTLNTVTTQYPPTTPTNSATPVALDYTHAGIHF